MIIIHTEGGCEIIRYITFSKIIMNFKRSSIMLTSVMCIMFLLIGCGSSTEGSAAGDKGNGAQNNETSPKSDPFANVAPAEIVDTQTGISDMSGLIKSLKQAIEGDQVEEAKQFAQQMAGLWNALKADIEAADAAKSQTMQDELSQLIQATNESKWNKEFLIELDYKLYQSFRDLKQQMQSQ